ncbi:MAG: hypothetical protein H6736_15775 [Alphaproteobacteria bacterium]|nr:hypothetical protein [Alphaproteobacteria bacterium]MCB9693270.1 hypothetical protein [Alphaproteobacteria bacterium]
MAWRIALGVWGALGTVGLVLFATGGRLSPTEAVDAVAGLGALVALFAVVKLPWDLYFAARGVQRTQSDSGGREIRVPDAERHEASRLARRLLAVAVSLHLLGAGVCAAVAWASDGRVGLFAAGAFLVTLALRPTAAMVGHVRARLRALERRAVLPPPDARTLGARLHAVEHGLKDLSRRLDDDRSGLVALSARLDGLSADLEARLTSQERRHRDALDRLGLEMERSLEKLTRDKEVIAGLRAFLQMVRDG